MSLNRHSQISTAILVLLPALSALASYTGNRDLLLVIYFLVSLAAFVAVGKWKGVEHGDLFFVTLIWSISLSLLLSSVLVSGNLRGHDIHDEYRISSEVLALHRWNPEENSPYNSVISIGILVPMLSISSGLSTLTVHALVLPIVYSIAPLVVYKIYRTIVGTRVAFLSTLLFMFFPAFYGELIQLGRQMVAEVLLLVLILTLLSRRRGDSMSYSVVIIFLTIGFVTAHYSLVFIFLVFLVFSSLMPLIRRGSVPLVNFRVLLVMLVVSLAWYVYVAGGIVVLQVNTSLAKVVGSISADFFSPSSRATAVQLATGAVSGLPGILHDVNRFTQYLVQVLLVIGFLAFLRKPRKTVQETQMVPLMAAALVFLVLSVILPFLASTLELTRIYHIALLFISPCLAFGIEQIDSTVSKIAFHIPGVTNPERSFTMNLPHISVKGVILATVLFSYFLFTSGWVWAITSDQPTSLILDSERMQNSSDPKLVAQYYADFIQPPDVAAAIWLKQNRAAYLSVCSDAYVKYGELTSYGGFPRSGPNAVNTVPYPCSFPGSYVYLSEYNNVGGFAYSDSYTPGGGLFPTSRIWPKLAVKNRVFSDGAAVYL